MIKRNEFKYYYQLNLDQIFCKNDFFLYEIKEFEI